MFVRQVGRARGSPMNIAGKYNRGKLSNFLYKAFCNMSEQSSCDRGALIVVEGCDRAGKTTQCRLLDKNLSLESSVKLMKYPGKARF